MFRGDIIKLLDFGDLVITKVHPLLRESASVSSRLTWSREAQGRGTLVNFASANTGTTDRGKFDERNYKPTQDEI
jgi:hypothetical protein